MANFTRASATASSCDAKSPTKSAPALLFEPGHGFLSISPRQCRDAALEIGVECSPGRRMMPLVEVRTLAIRTSKGGGDVARRGFAGFASCAVCGLTGFIATDASAQGAPTGTTTPGVT